VATSLALVSGSSTALGQSEIPTPAPCFADVVFFLDTSGSVSPCLGRLLDEADFDPDADRTNPSLGTNIVDGIRDAILALNAIPNTSFTFTVYYATHDPANNIGPAGLIDLYQASIDDLADADDLYIPNLQVLDITSALVTNRPDPSCLTRPNLTTGFGQDVCQEPPPPASNCTSCGSTGLEEDWGHAQAHIALYHPWRLSFDTCNDNYSRIYFPISDEGPRCGSPCLFPGNMDNAIYGDPDWRSVVDSSVCAWDNGLRSMPITGCCITGTQNPATDPTDNPSTATSCSVSTCVTSLASRMALLTTGRAEWTLNTIGWDSEQISLFIFDRTEAYLCERPVLFCDSIDFNNDTLFPSDDDLIDFLNVLAGGPCSNDPNCNDIDFNNDCLFPDDGDLLAFLIVLAGGPCPQPQ
jgi:hypothetical protein